MTPRPLLLGGVLLLALASGAWPARAVVFPGGSLAALRALDAELRFDELVVTGALVLAPSDGTVVLQVGRLQVSNTGSIGYDQGACSYAPPPDVWILAAGSVEIAGRIDLRGKFGTQTLVGSQCNQCQGVRGGELRIQARDIRVSDRSGIDRDLIDVSGGWGSTEKMQVGSELYSYGCDAGDGGTIVLDADRLLDLEQARFAVDGGEGGFGNQGSGADGADGVLQWIARRTEVEEIEPNGSDSKAQRLLPVPLVLSGAISFADDASEANYRYVSYPGQPNDRLEDLFSVQIPPSGPRGIRLEARLEAALASADLDLFLIDPNTNEIVAQSNGPPGLVESFDVRVGSGSYLLGVSRCCPPVVLPGPPPTAYALTLQASGLPEPGAASAAMATWVALAALARHRAAGA